MMKKTLLFLFLLVSTSALFSQQLYDSILQELSTKYPQEKMYIQLDKNYYSPGETVWFKAYIKADEPGTQISTSLYAELINENGNIIDRKTMPILLGGAASAFDLPDTIGHSKIYIRTFTPWMLNFDSSQMYKKPVNILDKSTAVKKEPAVRYSLTFFPEGGDLVTGIESRLAFKTNDQDGKPFAIKGSVVDAQGKMIREFSSTHNGMGYINFKPEPGQAYKAIWKDLSGKQQETAIPAAKNNSATLSLVRGTNEFKYTITRSAETGGDMKEFILVAQQQQVIVYAAKINLKNKTTVTVSLPTDSLPDGVMQVTLFNKTTLPVAERLVYVKNDNQFFITDLHLVDKNITKKGKNVLQIDVGGTLKSNLSISVTDADLDVKTPASENIYSQLLLSADLKGSIYNPAYYFSSDEDSVQNQLDLVMMTNGWRRFNWEKLIAGERPQIKYKPETYLTVQGNIYGLTPAQINGKMITGFLQAGKTIENALVTAPIEKDGSFKIEQLYFFDTLKLLYQINGDKNKRLTEMATFSFKNNLKLSPAVDKKGFLQLDFAPQPPKVLALKSISQSNAYLETERSKKVKVLETVSVTSTKKSNAEKLDKELTSGLFSGSNARIFSIEDDPSAAGAMSVLDYLRSRVPGLQISTSGVDGGSVTRRGSGTDMFMDEMRADIQMVQSVPMSQVAMIKVFDPPFFGSFGGGAGGAIAVYTKRGGAVDPNAKGLNVATITGYSALKEFYSPDYSTEQSPLPDYRTTLYWNPFILMNAQNKRVTLPFYNSDGAKRLRVIIEGINELGQLTREEKVFE